MKLVPATVGFCIGLLAVSTGAVQAASVAEQWRALKTLPDWTGTWEPVRPEAGGNPRGMLPPLDLTPVYAARRDAIAEKVRVHHDNPSNTKLCRPSGMPNLMMRIVRLYEFLYTPGQVTVLSQTNETRRIYTDGRKHPEPLTQSFAGDSIGHWEGDTLVIDTVGVRPDAEFVVGNGLQLGEASKDFHLVERLKRDAQELHLDAVLTTPTALAKPYVYTYRYGHSNFPLMEEVCAQNNRDIDPLSGAQHFDLDKLPPELLK